MVSDVSGGGLVLGFVVYVGGSIAASSGSKQPAASQLTSVPPLPKRDTIRYGVVAS